MSTYRSWCREMNRGQFEDRWVKKEKRKKSKRNKADGVLTPKSPQNQEVDGQSVTNVAKGWHSPMDSPPF